VLLCFALLGFDGGGGVGGCSLGGEGGQVVLKERNRHRRMPFCVGNNDTCILLDNN
jgi:hypothetical protein